MKNILIQLFTKTSSTFLSQWKDTLFVKVYEDGKLSFLILTESDTEVGEKAITNETSDTKTLYSQLLNLCEDQEWNLDEVIKAMPEELGILAKKFEIEIRKNMLDKELDDHIHNLVFSLIKSAIFVNKEKGLTNRRLLDEKIENYIYQFIDEHHLKPSGNHVIAGTKVTFP